MPPPSKTARSADVSAVEPWVELRVKVPPAWKRWLEEASRARAMSVSDLVRQCIRALMVTRHDTENGSST